MRIIRAIIIDDEAPARRRIRKLLRENNRFEIVGEAENGVQAVESIRITDPDLLFLDIQLKDITGFDVLKESSSFFTGRVIFITAYDEYAIKAFEANAVDYLLKPFKNARFSQALSRVTELHADQENEKVGKLLQYLDRRSAQEHLTKIQEGKIIHQLNTEDIIYIKSDGYYNNFFFEGKEKPKVIRVSLKDTEEVLPASFVRINRSVIINTKKISWVKRMKKTIEIEMISGEQFVTQNRDLELL